MARSIVYIGGKQMKKRDEALAMMVAIFLGTVLLTCSFFKITPGMDTFVAEIITTVIAYGGFLFGPIFLFVGIVGLIEIIHSDENLEEGTR